NLRLVTLAGQETLPGDRARFAAALPDTAFVVFYGQTEATTRILWLPPEDFLRHADAAGRPIPGVEARLEDDELVVTGPNVAAGWLDGPRFDGVLRTGDLFAPHPAGYRFLGRRDGVFKRAGEKVVPERIEAALRAHPAVESCLVSPERGARGDLEPVARVVTRQTVDAAALLRFCRATLPPAMVPARILLVPALAATLSGKVSRWPPA
ncbi:MAG: AMP-binding enzyme, partial [Myxococcota bacterium]